MPITQDEKAIQEAVRNILALRKLTRDSKTQTSRAQGEILQKLPASLLTRVARILAELEDAGERRGAFGVVPSVAEENSSNIGGNHV